MKATMSKLIDREILKALALDIFAGALGTAIFGLPVLFVHGLMA